MSSSFTLIVPSEDKNKETIKSYYTLCFDKAEQFISADSVEEFGRYRSTVKVFERYDRFSIHEQLLEDVAQRLSVPPVTMFDMYGNDNNIISDEIGLAKLEWLFYDTLREFESDNNYTYHLNLYGYLTLFEFAAVNEYKVSYP